MKHFKLLLDLPLGSEASSKPPSLLESEGLCDIGPVKFSYKKDPVQFKISFLSSLKALMPDLQLDQKHHLWKLLSLNPSRRKAIGEYLDALSGREQKLSLEEWVRSDGNEVKKKALGLFFHELNMLYLAQAVILKRWSDVLQIPFVIEDLGRLNWRLSSILKTKDALGRNNWHFCKPNLYSWFQPQKEAQKKLWTVLSAYSLMELGSEFLVEFFHVLNQESYVYPHLQDMGALLNKIFSYFQNRVPCYEKHYGFSPTLRNLPCALSHLAVWMGFEMQPFALYQEECFYLWNGPTLPPRWSLGYGIEPHDLFTTNIFQAQSAGMSAECDFYSFAFVLEEKILKPLDATLSSQEGAVFRKFKEEDIFGKKLRLTHTSLGTLQACGSLARLRPHGILVWVRQEPLSSSDEAESLNFLLKRATLLHDITIAFLEDRDAKFPRKIYIFQKDPMLEARLSNRPQQHFIQIHPQDFDKSTILADMVMHSIAGTPLKASKHSVCATTESLFSQKEWGEQWPDPTADNTIHAMHRLEVLRKNSIALSEIATVRPSSELSAGQAGSLQNAFWLGMEHKKIIVSDHMQESHFCVIHMHQSAWACVMKRYFESSAVSGWLEVYGEQKHHKAHLTIQTIKWIPIPIALIEALKHMTAGLLDAKALEEIRNHPLELVEKIYSAQEEAYTVETQADIFIQASYVLDSMMRLDSHAIVDTDGMSIDWGNFFKLIPSQETMSILHHPAVVLKGGFLENTSIAKIQKVFSPQEGFLCFNEQGHSAHIGYANPTIGAILQQQIMRMAYPTWSEICSVIKLPKDLEQTHKIASEILHNHLKVKKSCNALRCLIDCLKLY